MHRASFLASLCTGALAAFVLAGAPAHAAPILSEVFYDASGSDDGQLFVELAGEPGESVDDLALEGVNGSNGAVGPVVALSGSIGADGLFVVADALSDGTTAVAGADLLANFDFQNGPDSIQLVDPQGGVLDAVGYGDFGSGEIFAGEGTPAPDPAAGSSLARRFADVDSDDNAADFVALSAPTPGTAPFANVPEPGTAVLLLVGSGGIAALARPRRRA